MIYIIGGVSRAGKSTVTQKIARERSISYIPSDVLMTTLLQAGNPYDTDYKADSDLIAVNLWSFTKNLLCNLDKQGGDFLIEGIMFWPSLLFEISKDISCKACFLGYQELEPALKLKQLRAERSQTWHNRKEFNEMEYLAQITNIRIISKRLEEACQIYDFPYIESGDDIKLLEDHVCQVLF